jgi:hypothetical protein
MAIAGLLKADLERLGVRTHAKNLLDQYLVLKDYLRIAFFMTTLLRCIAGTRLLSRSSHQSMQGT